MAVPPTSQRNTAAHAATAVLVLVLGIAPGSAFAQWAWRDASGHVTYSDAPPPASVPQSQVIEQPKPGEIPLPDASGGSGKAAAKSTADEEKKFEAWYKKRQEAEKKQAAEQAKRNAECNRLRGRLATLKTLGLQVIQQSPNGGAPAFMTDDQRTAQAAQIEEQISASCD